MHTPSFQQENSPDAPKPPPTPISHSENSPSSNKTIRLEMPTIAAWDFGATVRLDGMA